MCNWTHLLNPAFALLAQPSCFRANRNDGSVVGEILGEVAEEVDQQLSDIVAIGGLPVLRESLEIVEKGDIMPVKLELFERNRFRRRQLLEITAREDESVKMTALSVVLYKKDERKDRRILDLGQEVNHKQDEAIGAQCSAIRVVDLASLGPDLD